MDNQDCWFKDEDSHLEFGVLKCPEVYDGNDQRLYWTFNELSSEIAKTFNIDATMSNFTFENSFLF